MTDTGVVHPSIAAEMRRYAGAIAMVAVSTLIGLWIAPRWGIGPVDMIYLPAVLTAAVLWGLGPALVAGVGAALAYNFFFTEPIHTLRIDRAADIVTVAVLLIVALVTSKLAAGVREQAQIAAAHAARNATIAGFAGRLLPSSGEAEIAEVACTELHQLFDCNAILVAGLPHPKVLAVVPTGNQLTPSDVAAAALTLETGEPAGRGTARMQPAEWVFHSVHSGPRMIAAAGLARDDGLPPVNGEQLQLLGSLLDQLALALERERLAAETRRFAETRKRDRLRSALLASIGQEVRPRLEAIGAAARELRRSSTAETEIVSTIGAEALKIDRYVANLVELGPEGDQRPIEVEGISIDLFNRSVSRDGEPVHLTPKEYAVLAELAKHRGRLLTHAQLLRAVWGPAQEQQIDYLRVAIRSIRQKLERDPTHPKIIVNEPAVGYRLSAEC